MNPDVMLILGLLLMLLALPSMVASLSDLRLPRFGVLVLIAGVALAYYAHTQSPEGYALSDIPDVFFRVLAKI